MAAAVTEAGVQMPAQESHVHDLTLPTPANVPSNKAEGMDTSDENEFEAEDVEGESSTHYDVDAGSVVGVSMGRAQMEMKSPITPAATKAQALEASQSYFDADPDGHQLFEEPLQTQTSPPEDSPSAQRQRSAAHAKQVTTPPPSPWRAINTEKQGRSSLVSSILGTTNSNSRPRSGSGSSIVESIKKRLPGIPSISLPKIYGFGEQEIRTLGPASPSIPGHSRSSQRLGSTNQPANARAQAHLDGVPERPRQALNSTNGRHQKIGHETESPQPGMIRRATSDQSLYLRREVTGFSEFDDYTAFSNVSEQVNSRFKAITDSFQDSALRMPKLPSISTYSKQGYQRTNSGETNTTTDRSVGSLKASDMAPSWRQTTTVDISSSKHPVLKEALSRMTGDLVVMGGYRGSILREAQPPHRQLWVPIKVGMNLRKADLEVGLTREDELRTHEKIIADGTLSHIGPVDICRRLLRKIKHCPNAREGRLRLHDYGYDWRLSPDLLSDRLIKYLEALPCNKSNLSKEHRGAWVIAHSLGGLITRHAVNRRPDLFAGVVYAGTPQNCVNILGPLRNGDDVLFSSRVLTAQTNFTLRTSFALLPQNGRCFLNKQTGERYDVDFFDVRTWEEYRLSPCIQAPLHRERPEKKTGLLGSISEAISQPNKRSSWFGSLTGNGNTDQQAGTLTPQQVKEKAEEAREDVEEAVEAGKPERPLSPNMQDGSSQSAKNKPSVATQSTIPGPVAREYLRTTLASVLEFKQNLAHRPEIQNRNAYPPSGILYAKNTPTVYGAFVTSRDAIKYDDSFDDLAFAAGDGVVLASAAQLPNGYRCVRSGRVESDRGHVGLLGDLEGVGKCLNAVMDARLRGVGMGAYDRCSEPETAKADVMPESRAE